MNNRIKFTTRIVSSFILCILLGSLTIAPASTSAASSPSTTLVDVAYDGSPASGDPCCAYSDSASVSANGRYVAFESTSNTLVPGDTNIRPDGSPAADIFLRDTVLGTIKRVSVASDGTQADGESHSPSISSDGQHVAFWSNANNLAPTSNGLDEVYLHDVATGQTFEIGVGPNGEAPDGPSYNRQHNNHLITPDNRFLVFDSGATDLVPGAAPDLGTGVYIRDLTANSTRYVGPGTPGAASEASITADGRYVVFNSDSPSLGINDPSTQQGVFLFDTVTGQTNRVDIQSDGSVYPGQATGVISPDGTYAVFMEFGLNGSLNQIYAREFSTAQTTLVTKDGQGNPGNGDSNGDVTFSGDSRFVAFSSSASNLVPNDSNGMNDAFVWDRTSGSFSLGSVATGGSQANDASYGPSLSYNGEFVAFDSYATNLTSSTDTNGLDDVFLRDRGPTYSLTGFLQPVDNPPTFNVVTATAGVPLKFSLGGDFGLHILAAGSPNSFSINCTDATSDMSGQTVAVSASSLTYDSTNQQYVYVWKTDRAWKGTCRAFSLTLTDGSTHVAYFKFK